jgi:hypothetical protein
VTEHDPATLFLGLLGIVGAIVWLWILWGKRRDAAAERREHPHDQHAGKKRRIE